MLLRRSLLSRSGFSRLWKILSSVDVETETMTCTRFRQGALDGFVYIRASDGIKWDGLVPCIHHREVFDMLDSLDGDTGLYPSSSPVGEVIPPFGTFVDGVLGRRKVRFHHLPGPCPGEIGQIALLLRVLIAVNSIERLEYSVFLHNKGFNRVEHIRQEPPS